MAGKDFWDINAEFSGLGESSGLVKSPSLGERLIVLSFTTIDFSRTRFSSSSYILKLVSEIFRFWFDTKDSKSGVRSVKGFKLPGSKLSFDSCFFPSAILIAFFTSKLSWPVMKSFNASFPSTLSVSLNASALSSRSKVLKKWGSDPGLNLA